jgi:hypothetical protein
VAALEIFARDSHLAIRRRTDGVDDLIVQREQVISVDVLPEHHVSEVAETGVLVDLLELPGDRLDRLVIGCHAVANQAVRGRQTVEHVHADVVLRLLEERFRGEVGSRTGAHNGDPRGSRVRVQLRVRHLSISVCLSGRF